MTELLVKSLRYASTLRDRQIILDTLLVSSGNAHLSGVIFSGINLSGLRFNGLQLSNSDFRESMCVNVAFPVMHECLLDGVNASGSSFSRMTNCKLVHTNLVGAHFPRLVKECDFTRSNLSYTTVSPLPISCDTDAARRNCFAGANLQGVDAAATDFRGSCFRDAILTDAGLARANLSGCDFANADFSRANLLCACLEQVNFGDATLHDTLTTQGQAVQIQSLSPSQFQGLKISNFDMMPFPLSFGQKILAYGAIKFEWRISSPSTGQQCKLMLTNRISSQKVCGYSFRAVGSELIRMYSADDSNSLEAIIQDMAIDYSGWSADGSSIVVDTASHLESARLRELVCRLIHKAFEIR
jgi:uncharacterized protein YjbI with pentapeptide repeats